MFEYINPGFYLLSGILVVMALLLIVVSSGKTYSENTKAKIPIFPILIIIFSIGVPIYDGVSKKNAITQNMKLFTELRVLKCSTFSTSYLVSKSNAWDKYHDGFTKDSLFIRADHCNEEKG